MIYPTRRAVYLAGVPLPVALLIAILAPDLWLFAAALAGAALLMVIVDIVMAPPPRAVGIDVELPPVLYIGATDPLFVRLRLDGGARPIAVELACDNGALLPPMPSQAHLLAPGGTLETVFELTPERRGVAVVERVWIRWRGPLGLIWRRAIRQLDAEIPVLPNIRAVRMAALQFFSRNALIGQKSQRQLGDGSDFDALRDWVPGLDRRSVDWKHSARHRKLVSKEFRAERNHVIVLAYDTGYLMSEPLERVPKLDRAINAGLLLAYASLRHGDRVALYGFDSQVRMFTEPVAGVQNFHRVQHASTQLDYHHEEANYTLALTQLQGRLNRRSLVILMTDFIDTVTAEMMVENIERLANRHLVMFVSFQDPTLAGIIETPPGTTDDMARAAVADDFAREREIVLERLARAGVHCLEAPHDAIDSEMINRYLVIKQRELI